jgi:hypothetical protein
MKNPLDKIEYLTQPLLTEEGFLNEACINELSAWINNFPKTYARSDLLEDPEWSQKKVTSVKEITGYFAQWAVRQEDFVGCPPNLEKIITHLDQSLRTDFAKIDKTRWGEMGYGNFSLCEINKMLWDILGDLSIFQEWNTKECLGEHWLDLDALLHNVCLSIRDERRKNDEFNRKFEEEHGEFTEEEK